MATILAIDLGKYKSVACIFDSLTGEYSFKSIPTTPCVLESLFSSESPDRIVIEVGSQAGWIADLAESLEIEIQVANPSSEAWLWKNVTRKTDRDDALRLAQMSNMGNMPVVHMPKKNTRQWRGLIAFRNKLISRRTAIKNSIRSILDQQGISWPSGRAGWTKQTLQNLKVYCVGEDDESAELWHVQIAVEYESLLHAEQMVKSVEQKLDALAKADERVARLRTIPGVGPRLAEIVVAIIDDPHRFRNGKQVGAYAGLVPKQYESGTMSRQGRITGRGNSLLRAILIEVGWLMRRYNDWFRKIFEKVCRGAKTRKKIAVVAVARRLLICCWAMLRKDQDWRGPAPQVA